MGSALSGWDAARLYGLGPECPLVPQVLILQPGGENRLLAGVRFRRTDRPYVWRYVTVDGALLRVAPPARAVADAVLDCRWPNTAQAMVTAAVQRGLCTVDDLVHEYETGPRNRSYHLRRAVLDVVGGARSVAEATAAQALRAGNVPPFEMNVPVVVGSSTYVADFAWPRLRAILEIDSRQHHFLERDWLATMARHNALSAAGYVVEHWAPTSVASNPAAFADAVRHWLFVRAAELGVDPFP